MTPDFGDAPVPLSFSDSVNTIAKITWLFGHYDLRVYISHNGYIDVGRGSFGAALSVSSALKDYSGCVGTVGQFCDFSASSELLAGGEHRNENNVNITFANIKAFQTMIAKHGIHDLNPLSKGPIVIGNAVVVSANAVILGGVHVGNGALIAANALVRTNVEPFSVYGGVPAKKVKDRLSLDRQLVLAKVRWWDFDLVYLGNNLARLQDLAVDTTADHIYRKPTPRIVLKLLNIDKPNQHLEIMGFAEGSQLLKLSDAPAKVQHYVSQIGGRGPYNWVANVWE